jgi:hypothetical protein
MCASCVQDLEQFNKSLRNKTNLLNADIERQGSFVHLQGDVENEKAPRNRKDSFDSNDDDQVRTYIEAYNL